MARRSRKKSDWLDAAVGIAAAVGFVSGLQWPGSGNQKLYTGAAGAFIGAVLVLALSFWLTRLKRNPFHPGRFEPGSFADDPWPKDAGDQYPMWKEASERGAQNAV